MGETDQLTSWHGALCDYCRDRPAVAKEWLYVPGGARFWFICFDCLEGLIERENALAIAPNLRGKLPPVPAPNWKER